MTQSPAAYLPQKTINGEKELPHKPITKNVKLVKFHDINKQNGYRPLTGLIIKFKKALKID